MNKICIVHLTKDPDNSISVLPISTYSVLSFSCFYRLYGFTNTVNVWRSNPFFSLFHMLLFDSTTNSENGLIYWIDISTKCLVSLRALCCHLWRDININTNQGRVLWKVSCTKNLPLGEYLLSCKVAIIVQ